MSKSDPFYSKMDNTQIVVSIFYLGIVCSNDRGTKNDERILKALFNELEKRGIIPNGAKAYEMTTK